MTLIGKIPKDMKPTYIAFDNKCNKSFYLIVRGVPCDNLLLSVNIDPYIDYMSVAIHHY